MTREIPLTRGYVALIDDADYEWLSQWKWYCVRTGRRNVYAARKEHKKTILMHRIILCPANGYEVDHIDGNGLNNTRANLRECTRSQNCQNKCKPNHSISLYKGTTLNRHGKWAASIHHENKQVHLGTYDTPEQAALAYDEAARRYFGEFAKLNFPDRSANFVSEREARIAVERDKRQRQMQKAAQNKYIRIEINRRLLAGETPDVIASALGVKWTRVYKAHRRIILSNQGGR